MRRIFFEIGSFPVQSFGTMIALGILAGVWLAVKEARRKGMDENKLFDFLILAIFAGIIGARLGFVLFYDLSYYLQNPIKIFYINQGGMSIHGAIIASILAALWWCKKNNLSFWKLADTLAPSLILGQAIGRVGCDVFGQVMAKPYPWGVLVNGQLLHPAQVYEFLLDYLLFFFIWRKRKKQRFEGELFLYYLIGFNFNRGIVEFLRTNPYVIKPVTVGHFFSLLFILLGLALFWYQSRKVAHQKVSHPAAAKEEVFAPFWRDLLAVLVLIIVSLLLYYGLPPA